MTADKPQSEGSIKSICLRCKRSFTPKQAGQLYGEKCLRKMRGQTVLLDRYLVGPRKRKRKIVKDNRTDDEKADRSFITADKLLAANTIISKP